MRFATFTTQGGQPRTALVREDGYLIDLAAALSRSPESTAGPLGMIELITEWESLRPQVEVIAPENQAALGAHLHSPENVQLLAPLPRPPKNVMCLGRNYPEHAAESARAFGESPAAQSRPEFPTIFTKAHTALIGPYDDIIVDAAVSEYMDWEVELAVVIGKSGANIPVERANDFIFGYAVLNDVTARDLQRRYGGQFFKGKSLDRSTPFGPWIVTVDELPEIDDLILTLIVDGVQKQQDRVGSMLFTVPEIVSAISAGMTLEPGDMIATGTPGGVGFARNPPEFLRPGCVVEAEITRIGKLRNMVVGPGADAR
jgi:2-keto-4-pentenoate hydratase/2-oxohepta-3-ene-1,7-dioic acid hydratase in catechol pathway